MRAYIDVGEWVRADIAGPVRITGVLNYSSDWAYQNDSSLNNFDGWVDGVPTNENQPDHPTSFDIKNMITPNEVYFTFPERLNFELTQIRLFDGQGGVIGLPVRIHGILRTGEKILDIVPAFHREGSINYYGSWHTHQVAPEYKDIQAIIYEKTDGATYPTEIEFTGTYTPYIINYPEIPKTKLGHLYGVNSFPWNNSGHYEDINDPDAQELLSRYDYMYYHRDYFDWALTDDGNTYAYAPTHSGGWNQDRGYQRLKDKGIKTLRAVKNLPPYLYHRYPQALDVNGKQDADRSNRNGEAAYLKYIGNIVEYHSAFPASGNTADLTYTLADQSVNVMFPYTLDEPTYFYLKDEQIVHSWDGSQYVPLTENPPNVHFEIYDASNATAENPIGKLKTLWGTQCTADRNKPESYIDYAKMAFQDAARYGSNTNVDSNLVKSGDGLVGLDLIYAWEAGNELNAFWHWRRRYLSPTEMACLLSAIYDGHLNTMGDGVGVKNADPNLLVANGGIVSANPRFFRAMMDWCRDNRGLNEDGTVNVPWDIVKYHQYTNSKGLEQHSGGSDRVGLPADMVSTATEKVTELKQVMYEYTGKYYPVHIGENGYDEGPSTQSVPVIEGTESFDENTLGINNTQTGYQRTRTQIRGDWVVRDRLEYTWCGLDSMETYLLEDPGGGGGDNPYSNVNLYATSGLSFRGDYLPAPREPRPAMWYSRQQCKYFGDYTPVERLSSDPIVQKHEDSEGNIMYALWVPDCTGRTEEYTLSLPGITTVKKYTHVDDTYNMGEEVLAVDDTINITVTETPVYLEVVTAPIITVEVTFDSEPTTATANFADLKYNKEGVFNYEQDDSSRGIYYNLFPFLNGGVAQDEVEYPGKFFTDGCGNQVKAKAAAATNSVDWFGDELHIEEGTTNIRYSDMAEMVKAGWSIENHGAGVVPPSDRWLDIHLNTRNLYKRIKEFGAEMRTRIFIVPANDPEYVDPAFYAKHVVVSSQSTFDGYDVNHPVTPLPFILENLDKLMLQRRFTESITTEQAEIWLDEFFTSLNGGTKTLLRCFSHNIQNTVGSFGLVKHIYDYIEANAADRVWITTMQDLYEYLETKRDVLKSESLVGNKLTIQLDLSNISDLNRYRDMSLLIDSDATITSVSVTGADSSTHNLATGLINIFKENTTFPDPALEEAPPLILDVKVEEANKVTILYSKAVTQTTLGYEIPGKTITGIEGSGDTWKLVVLETILETDELELTYRMRLGDAVDASDPTKLLNSYVGKTIRNRLNISPDVTAPTTPVNFRARKITSDGYELIWGASTDNEELLGYNLEVDGRWDYKVLTDLLHIYQEEAEKTHTYRVRAVDINYNYSEPTELVTVTTLAFTDYQVERTIKIGFHGNEATLNSFGWNKPIGADFDVINTPSEPFKETDGYRLTDDTSVTITTLRAFTQEASGQPAPGDNSGVFPDGVLNSAWRTNDTSAGTDYLKVSGLNPDKYYNFYILGNVTGPDSNARYTVGGISNDKAIYNNYVMDANPDTPLESSSLSAHKGIQCDVNGDITIYIEKLGPADWVAINGLVIEETNNNDSDI